MTAAARFAPILPQLLTRARAWRDLSLAPFELLSALRVIEDLDRMDRLEIQLGGVDPTPDAILRQFVLQDATGSHLQIVWRHRPEGGAEPFAIVMIDELLARGTASAALIARDHVRFAAPLRRLVAGLRADLPGAMAQSGLRRLECRCWAEHPTAPGLLTAIGFAFETELHGFGLSQTPWLQFALVPEKGS